MIMSIPVRTPLRQLGLIAALLMSGAFLFAGVTAAQEDVDPTPTVAEAPGDTPTTAVFLEIEAPTGEPVNKGDTFLVHVMVSDVENLSAFDFQLSYDDDRVEPIKLDDGQDATPVISDQGTPTTDQTLDNTRVEGELGQFLADGDRDSLCSGPTVRSTLKERVLAFCVGVNLPVCAGGPAGVDGSGRLGTVVFKSRGGEMTQIGLVSSVLTSDDAGDPCEDLVPVRIDHSLGPPATVALSGGGGSSGLIIILLAIVALAAVAGVGGFLFYRQRMASA